MKKVGTVKSRWGSPFLFGRAVGEGPDLFPDSSGPALRFHKNLKSPFGFYVSGHLRSQILRPVARRFDPTWLPPGLGRGDISFSAQRAPLVPRKACQLQTPPPAGLGAPRGKFERQSVPNLGLPLPIPSFRRIFVSGESSFSFFYCFRPSIWGRLAGPLLQHGQ